MKWLVSSILLLSPTALAVSDRQDLVDKINAAGLTWHAAVDPKFAGVPLGSSKHLYGAKSMGTKEILHLISEGKLTVAPKVSREVADSLPEAFDSEDNWPMCAKVIGDIRDQSNCGCCWAFGAASAASDRACIASNGTIAVPFSAQDVCFNAESSGCNGGTLFTPWHFISTSGVVTGGQYLDDIADTPSDPFDGEGFCASFSLPHCHHHGDVGDDPYPAEGDDGCPSVRRSPSGPTACDDTAVAPHDDYDSNKYSFTGTLQTFPSDSATIMASIMADGPVEAAFSVYSDFENYDSGIYQKSALSTYEGGHAIRIVGWGTEDGTDYWKVANSWNPYWGEDGYFRILRGEDECGIESSVYASGSRASWSLMSEQA